MKLHIGKEKCQRLWLGMIVGLFLASITACAHYDSRLPQILTAKDAIQIILEGQTYTAIGSEGEAEFTADADKLVMDKGKYLEDLKRWDNVVFALKKKEKKRTMVFGGIIAVITLITVLLKRKKR